MFHGFNLFDMGFMFAALFVNLLLMGWAMGLFTTGIIVRFGPPAEALAWAVPFLIQPASAVFYPVSVLPPFLQTVSKFIPASYVFEGMRDILGHKSFDPKGLLIAFSLNVMYMLIAAFVFKYFFEEARMKGLLAKHGS